MTKMCHRYASLSLVFVGSFTLQSIDVQSCMLYLVGIQWVAKKGITLAKENKRMKWKKTVGTNGRFNGILHV